VRVAFSRRFAYALTGTFFRGGYAGTGQPDRTLEADATVILRWDRVEATKLGGRKLLVSAGAAGGTVPKLLRFAFVEANLQLDGWGLFGRAGAAYGRMQDETVPGVSGGLEVSFAEGAVIGRLASGRRDWEVVDRVGSSDRNALMLFVGGGGGSDAPKRRKQEES
jgi:hypothetical protein